MLFIQKEIKLPEILILTLSGNTFNNVNAERCLASTFEFDLIGINAMVLGHTMVLYWERSKRNILV